ncbi:MAG: hypothetical protein ACKPCM_18510, partial [Pseudanabaena sp.]
MNSRNFRLIGLTQTERVYWAGGRWGAGFARTTSTQCVSPTFKNLTGFVFQITKVLAHFRDLV